MPAQPIAPPKAPSQEGSASVSAPTVEAALLDAEKKPRISPVIFILVAVILCISLVGIVSLATVLFSTYGR